jgi:hypothetical protein
MLGSAAIGYLFGHIDSEDQVGLGPVFVGIPVVLTLLYLAGKGLMQ